MTNSQILALITTNLTPSGGSDKVDASELRAVVNQMVADSLNPNDPATPATLKTLYESVANAYTTLEKNKLASIESGATADMTAGEIKTAYESNSNTNAFTDAEKSKLAGLIQKLYSSTSSVLLQDTANTITATYNKPVFSISTDSTLDATFHNSLVVLESNTSLSSHTITLPSNISNFIVQFKVKEVPATSSVYVRIINSESFDTGTLGISETVTNVSGYKRISLPVNTDLTFIKSSGVWYVGSRIQSVSPYPAGRYVIPATGDQTLLQTPANWTNDNYTGSTVSSFPSGSFWYNNVHTFENAGGTIVRNAKASTSGGSGNMNTSVYDPTGINGSAFDLNNHTGLLDFSRIGYNIDNQLTYASTITWDWATKGSGTWIELTGNASLNNISNSPATGQFYLWVINRSLGAKISFGFSEGQYAVLSYPDNVPVDAIVEVVITKFIVDGATKWKVSSKQLSFTAADTPPTFTSVTISSTSTYVGSAIQVDGSYSNVNGYPIDYDNSVYQLYAYDNDTDATAAGDTPSGGTVLIGETPIPSLPFNITAPVGLDGKVPKVFLKPVANTGTARVGSYKGSNNLAAFSGAVPIPSVAYSELFTPEFTGTSTYTRSFTLNTTGLSDTRLFIWISGSQPDTQTVNACTVGGVSATLLINQYQGGSKGLLSVFEIKDADLPADGSVSVVMTTSGASPIGSVRGGVVLVKDCEQGTFIAGQRQFTGIASNVSPVVAPVGLTASSSALLLSFITTILWYSTLTPDSSQTLLHTGQIYDASYSSEGATHVFQKTVSGAGVVANSYTPSSTYEWKLLYEILLYHV